MFLYSFFDFYVKMDNEPEKEVTVSMEQVSVEAETHVTPWMLHPMDAYLESVAGKFVCVRKIFQTSYEITNSLTSTISKLQEPLKTECIEHLEACLSAGQWLETSRNQKPVLEYTKDVRDHFQLKCKFEIGKICERFSSGGEVIEVPRVPLEPTIIRGETYRVNVLWVTNPGEFAVVRESDENLRKRIISTLKKAASSYEIPEEISSTHIYAVRISDNWFRGKCGGKCGTSSIGDNPPEVLYRTNSRHNFTD